MAVSESPEEKAALSDPKIRAALDGALSATRDQLIYRGSFAAYAEVEEGEAP